MFLVTNSTQGIVLLKKKSTSSAKLLHLLLTDMHIIQLTCFSLDCDGRGSQISFIIQPTAFLS